MGKTRNTNGERDREGDPGSKIPEKENPTKKKKGVKERSNKKAEDVAKASEMVSLYVQNRLRGLKPRLRRDKRERERVRSVHSPLSCLRRHVKHEVKK